MKKALLLSAVIGASLSASAQITLEKDYSSPKTVNSIRIIEIEGEGEKYYGNDSMNVFVYNANHTLFKSIPINLPSGTRSEYTTAHYPSTKLFDNDNGVEVLITYVDANYDYQIKVLDENGATLFTAVGYPMINKIDGKWKLIMDAQRVYSLPGSLPSTGMKPSANKGSEGSIYPNPFGTSATIAYSLPAGVNQGTLKVVNSAGTVVRGFTVTSQFDNVLIERGDLAPGVYSYTIEAVGMQPVTNRFVVQ